MNKPKIKIVGVGHTGKILVENFSSEKVDLLSIANQDSKANPNDNIIDIFKYTNAKRCSK